MLKIKPLTTVRHKTSIRLLAPVNNEGGGQNLLTILTFYTIYMLFMQPQKTFGVVVAPTLGVPPLKSVRSSPRTSKIQNYGNFPHH